MYRNTVFKLSTKPNKKEQQTKKTTKQAHRHKHNSKYIESKPILRLTHQTTTKHDIYNVHPNPYRS